VVSVVVVVVVIEGKVTEEDGVEEQQDISSSSSSSALQPGVGFGLPSLLEGFVTMIVLEGEVVNPTPNPQLFWRTNVFCRGCLP
jgi:hypothetical protein